MNNIKINNFTEKLERYEDFHLKEIGNWIVVVFILKSSSDKILKMITVHYDSISWLTIISRHSRTSCYNEDTLIQNLKFMAQIYQK